jgi:putative ABC transport system ATP-binding protein
MVLDLLVRIHREQKMTTILVTHDMGIAAETERIIRMKDGRIESDDALLPGRDL